MDSILSLQLHPGTEKQADIITHMEGEGEKVQGKTAEENFLKDLHGFMKKRDTPIERIPHLGFKQIDLFLMYETVKDLGGYHEVTAQQLWKQVYNSLGGNPRSTSAATCTRRHYEKLLLPYECHVRGGEFLNVLSKHHSKQFHYNSLSKLEDCPRPSKRRALMLPLSQNPHPFLTCHQPVQVNPSSVHYQNLYHHNPSILPPYIPLSPSILPSHGHPPPLPSVSFPPPSFQSPVETSTEPLQHLRFLAEQYKSSAGLAEPLNLSVKDTGPDSINHAESSFIPPPVSNKNPKFLNKASPLYPPNGLNKEEGCDTKEDATAQEEYDAISPYSPPLKDVESYVLNLTSTSKASRCSPKAVSPLSNRSTFPAPTSLLQSKMSSSINYTQSSPPQRDCTQWSTKPKEDSPLPCPRGPNISDALPSYPGEKGNKMEIHIPLSVLQKWIRSYGSPTNNPPMQETDNRGQGCSSFEISPPRSHLTNLVTGSHTRDQERHPAIKDLSKSQRNVLCSSPTNDKAHDGHSMPAHHLSVCPPWQTDAIFKDSLTKDVYTWDEENTRKPFHLRPENKRECFDNSFALTEEQDIVDSAASALNKKTLQGKFEGSRRGAILMVNPTSPSVVHLTDEELMKLKEIISSRR